VTGFLIDTSVLLDLAESDPVWLDWSRATLEAASNDGFLTINPVIYAEFSLAFADIERLDAMLAALDLEVRQIPRPALFLAARQFREYRRHGGMRTGVLPDFFIGAHAAVERMTLITRDMRRRAWFPTVRVIAPHA
jgi:predicted nucleic acid-binding protein